MTLLQASEFPHGNGRTYLQQRAALVAAGRAAHNDRSELVDMRLRVAFAAAKCQAAVRFDHHSWRVLQSRPERNR